MTQVHNARLAGFAFLFYIFAGICGMIAFDAATSGNTPVARLASITAHSPFMSLSIICSVLTILCAIALAVTLFALTREEDVDLARLAMSCRLLEAAINTAPLLALVALAHLAKDALAQESSVTAVATLLLKAQTWSTPIAATMFAIGSAIFCALFLRSRLIPTWMAKLGFIASVLLIVAEPLEAVGLTKGFFAAIVWLPMLAFEVPFGVWLLRSGGVR
ncbi:MAG TPA: DUF4386 domain-containing protein [Chthoniobacterales bacterium]|jgi:hypothetical protein|nr:DUF4386 domain-containing protein [Chthoniobacterales bacterium]